MLLLNLLWIFDLLIFSSAINLNSSYSKDDLIMGNAEYFVTGEVKVKNLLISPCAKITFIDFLSQIIVLNGTVNVKGNSTCQILIGEKHSSSNKYALRLSPQRKLIFFFYIYFRVICFFFFLQIDTPVIYYLGHATSNMPICIQNETENVSKVIYNILSFYFYYNLLIYKTNWIFLNFCRF